MLGIIKSLGNILLYIFNFISEIMFVIWYGKLPKVSVYHAYSLSGITTEVWESKRYNDELLQSKLYPAPNKNEVQQFINYLLTDERFRMLSFKLYDRNGKSYGEESFAAAITKELDNFYDNKGNITK